MTRALAFWIVMFIWLIFGAWSYWPMGAGAYRLIGSDLMLFFVLGLLGWQVFGPPLKA